MEYSAITHFGDKRYCYALDKGKFLVRIKTKRNDMRRVILHYRDKYLPLSIEDTRQKIEMTKVCYDAFCDYYEAEITFDVVCLRYFFELADNDGNVTYLGNLRFFNEEITDLDFMYDCPQNMREEEMVTPPQWAKGKVVYQIFPTRFAASQPVDNEIWYKSPITAEDNLHGDLRGIINKLDYLSDLGIDVIYLNPIFRSDSCHKYDTWDYYTIDKSLGTEEDFAELVEKAHNQGMKIILDGVFNHTSQEFFAFKDVKEKGFQSKYIDWYFVDGFPIDCPRGKKPNFKCFAYYGGMPKLNLKNPEVEHYFINVGRYWVEKFGIDGWRLDVADEISHRFWKKFRSEIKKVNPDALIIGEIWHYAGDFLEGDEWDTVMNYDFFNAVLDLVARQCITPTQFMEQLGFLRGNLNKNTFHVLWNHLDTHDTARFLHHAKGDKEKQRLAAALQMLLPGMPFVYYGDEYGIDGANDPDCRRGMLWAESRQDKTLFSHYKRLIEIRKLYPEIQNHNLTEYKTDDKNGLITLESERVTLVFNTGNVSLALPEYKGRKDLVSDKTFEGEIDKLSVLVLENTIH